MNYEDIRGTLEMLGIDILEEQIYNDGMEENVTFTIEDTVRPGGPISDQLWDEIIDIVDAWADWSKINREEGTIQVGLELEDYGNGPYN